MKLKEEGFRPAYHFVCAFELNDFLRGLIKECPDANKASHAVLYGYIDEKKGFMLELLGAGKQAPKYFYFKEPYNGKKKAIEASKVADVEFMYFPDLENRFYKKFEPRINTLEKYNVSEQIEKSRELSFLDEFRDLQYPDRLKVIFIKAGLKDELVSVQMQEVNEHTLLAKVLEQPKQNFGVSKNDVINFWLEEQQDKSIKCVAAFDDNPNNNSEDNDLLKQATIQYLNDETEENLLILLSVLKNSTVKVAGDMGFDDEATEIINKIAEDDRPEVDATDEELEIIENGAHFEPAILEAEGHKFFPIFSSEKEIGNELSAETVMSAPFMEILEMVKKDYGSLDGIVLDAFTQNFIIPKEGFETIESIASASSDKGSFIDDSTRRWGKEKDISLSVGKMDIFNYALYENRVAPIRGIEIFNGTEDPIDGLSLCISSDFNFFKPYQMNLPPVPNGKPIQLEDPHLIINGTELAGLTEAVNATITVELCKNGNSICGQQGQMRVLAYDQWQGSESYIDLLPSFVLPNHPAISALMHDASDRLKKWKKPTSLEGYQMHDPNRVRDLAAAAYAAIQKKNIVYAEPPASFSVIGQRIRTPETILEQRLGTCMDMTLLYVALLEAMGLHPLLVLMKGHIFAGVWLKERAVDELKKSSVVLENLEELTMRIDNGTDEMTFIECTSMCSGNLASFEEAEKIAKRMNLTNDQNFHCAIDVYLSRACGVKPISSRTKKNGEYHIEIQDKAETEITDAPTDLGLISTETPTFQPKKITNKKELWESKLLDLSTHNMLLNLPLNSSIEPIMSSHIDELEDALSDGKEFNILPAANWVLDLSFSVKDEQGKQSKPKSWLKEALRTQGVFEISKWPVAEDLDLNEKIRQEYRNHRIYTFCSDKQLDRELTSIYRAARLSLQENGVSSLYMAIGLLRWFDVEDAKKPYYAPLILVPIEIVRKAANLGYSLHMRDEDAHFNTTLLEMLKQKFNLEIPGLEPLPTDSHGINIKKVFALIRGSLFKIKDWDVVETCAIGNFSFAKFAMWNDIHIAGETLENSNIVRSLMKGHVDWNIESNENLDNEDCYLPITVDGSQLFAVKMAAHGDTFVLHGPPGTGKSQTITAMIANLMAQGKKVLFVAEKMAALSVVQRRLTAIGVGDFCLELHSNKANKKQVLSQLDKVLAIRHPFLKTEYVDCFDKTLESREKLDDYAEHLHKTQNCGYSLRELIARYETVHDVNKYIRFDSWSVGKLTKENVSSHLPLIAKLKAAGEGIENIAENPLVEIGLQSYSADVRSKLGRVGEEYIHCINESAQVSERVATLLHMDIPQSPVEMTVLEKKISEYQDLRDIEPVYIKILNTNTEEVMSYFDAVELRNNRKEEMLKDWTESAFTLDVQNILAKHDAAGKKFFGKSNAMAAVTSEVQKYYKKKLSFEMIPSLLHKITEYRQMDNEVSSKIAGISGNAKEIIKELKYRDEFIKAYAVAITYENKAKDFSDGIKEIFEIINNKENNELFAQLKQSLMRLIQAEDSFNTLLDRKENGDTHRWFDREKEFCEFILDNQGLLKDWGLYNQVRKECINAGIKPVVDAYEQGIMDNLEQAYEKGFYYALINNIISSDDVLSSFSGATFNESIEQFKKLDDLLLDEAKKEIYYRLASSTPMAWDSAEIGKELNLLRKAIGSNARGMSIRELFDRIPHILLGLCPCMLMSPDSVAQYLAQRNDLFDVVIFDEASQLPTCKAIGALMRAKSAVIVGDPKQMPPTSFFAGAGPAVDDLAIDDLDSILDDALALGIPSQHLQWHYRSTHESLIAFSNHQFYGNKMFTFPSANDRERHVTAVHVDGLYEKNTNRKEAEAVVAEIIRRYHDPQLKKQSIGVVTFNIKQQALIENLLGKQFQSNPKLDAWANSGDDPLFIKNLENVQGDERDVIIFSIGYGPDEKGHVSNNFGPINKQGGGKRLNVAFSRARVTMTIFSSIYSTDIKVTETSPDGLVAFRDFLKYAEGHDIQSGASSSAQEKISKEGIVQNICKIIEEHGYKTMTMVGHSDFHIDIAIVNPFDSTKYLMGIMLDGDGYKQTKNTRDREVAQIGVLRNLGWTLTRVWTIDWWDNKDKEINKLLHKLDQLKSEEEQAIKNREKEEKNSKKNDFAVEKLKAELAKQSAELLADEEAGEMDSSISNGTQEEKTETPSFSEEENHSLKMNDVEKEKLSKKTPIEELVEKLLKHNARIVDKRQNGGALWVIGGKELTSIMQEFKRLGVYFIFKSGGGKATDGKDGWWAKTNIVLPTVSVAKEEKKSEKRSDDNDKVNADNSNDSGEPTPYVFANVKPITLTREFTDSASKEVITSVIQQIIQVESPILKDVLMRNVFACFGVSKSSANVDAFESAFRVLKVKTTKQKGDIYCWSDSQDPKAYQGIRVSNERSGNEICQQEISNAICYVLKQKGDLDKDTLIKETSLLLGYKRLGKNLESALVLGLAWSKTNGFVTLNEKCYHLSTQETIEPENTEVTESEQKVEQPVEKSTEVKIEVEIPAGAQVFYCSGEGYDAVAIKKGLDFVVLKGSKINMNLSSSCPSIVISNRRKCAERINANGVLTGDVKFASPTGAAAFVAGANKNGYTEWHTESGILLKDFK